MLKIILILLTLLMPAQAQQCIKINNTYNCGKDGVYRRIGNRVFGPRNKQYLIQDNQVSEIGTGQIYRQQGSQVVRNDGVRFYRQGSYTRSSRGDQYTKLGNFAIGDTDSLIPVEILLD